MLNNTEEKRLTPHICVIALDETEDIDRQWLKEVFARHGVPIDALIRYETCYLYDKSTNYFLCSFTPCYELQAYDGRFILREEYPYNDHEALYEELEDEARLWRTQYHGGDVIYVNCTTIDDLAEEYAAENDFRFKDCGQDHEAWAWMKQQEEDAPDGDTDANGYPTGSYEAYMFCQIEGVNCNAPI